MPVALLCGEDRYARTEALAELRAALDADGSLADNSATYDAARLAPSELGAAVAAAPFLGDWRFVRVDGLCGRFEFGSGRRQRGLGAWEGLDGILASVPPATQLVFIDDAVAARNPIRRAIEAAGGDIREFKRLRKPDALEWLRGEVRKRGVKMTRAAAAALVDRTNGDRGALAGTLEKLSLYAAGASVDERVIEQMTPPSHEATIFNLVDAVAEGRLADAMQALNAVRAAGEADPRILHMLARQFRLIVIARDVIDSGGGPPQIQNAAGLRTSWQAERLQRQARRYAAGDADAALARMLEADAAIQDYRRDDGGLPEELAVELLVAELAGRR